MIALASLSVFSCKDDDIIGPDEDMNIDRAFMTLFRTNVNTNRGDADEYRCQAIENDIHLAWYGVDNAAGYQIRMAGPTVWEATGFENPDNIILDTIVGPDVLEMDLKDLNYGVAYHFAIRTLSPKGEGYHSKWYGYGGQRENNDYMAIPTAAREDVYPVPEVVTISDRTTTSFKVNFDLSFANAGGDEGFKTNFNVDENGNFIAQYLTVKPAPNNPDAKIDPKWSWYQLSAEEFENGVVVDNLDANSSYQVDLWDRTIPVDVDATYNICAPRTSGIPGDPILIKCEWQNDTIPEAHEYKCQLLDTVLVNFMKNSELAEGQIFELEGGKNYYIDTNVEISKGLTLRTRQEDARKGLRAKVFLGGIRKVNGGVRTANFSFGMTKTEQTGDAPINVLDLIFEDIDFDSPLAVNYAENNNSSGSGNYFANCSASSLAATFNSYQIRNCSFQNLIRGGLMRAQGSTKKVFDKVIVENCVIWNCGYYDANGDGYNWFHGNEAANIRSNIFRNIILRGNTFIDSPHGRLFHDKDKANAWPSTHQWCFTVENNTFLNFNTRKNNQPLFGLRYIPGGTEFHVHNNLFIQAKDPDDTRAMNLALADIRTINSEPYDEIVLDIYDNYGSSWDPDQQADDKICSVRGFSATKQSLGLFTSLNPGLVEGGDLVIRVGAQPILPTELMQSPNPPYKDGDPRMHNRESFNGLFYNKTDKVMNHEIYKKGIGDTRWRDRTPETFWNHD